MQLRRKILVGVLGAGLVGSAFMVSRPATAQDAPPATQPTTKPDATAQMFQRTAGMFKRLDGMTDDQKAQIDALFADTATKLDAILTDAQKQQLADRAAQMNRWRNGGGGGRQRGGGGGGGNNNAGGGGGAPGQ